MLKYDREADLGTTLEPPDTLYEVVNGEYVEKPMSAESAFVAAYLQGLFLPMTMSLGLGRFTTETLFKFIQQKNRRRPDLAFVSYERWPKRKRLPETEAWHIVPEIVVEVVSPSNRADDLLAKIHEYFSNSVGEVWIVYPKLERLHRYETESTVRIYTRADTLTCEKYLPGFSVPMSEIFPEYDDEPAAAES